jgi:hypothetical protein
MMAPKLSIALKVRSSWFEIVSQQMGFPPTLPDKIKAIWESGKAAADEQGVAVDPNEFARQFVDTNFLS